MTAKQQTKRKAISTRLPQETVKQIANLERATGYTQTQLLIIAIDRFHETYFGDEEREAPPWMS